jgi:alpha-ketoglutarate-dependent taurine dioxygenase|tara:strand:+ start:8721 stop:9563 length:843 start_codon:yes stop_codon:yes gene_type:complete
MKLSIDSNGWTLTIQEDIKTLSQDQLHEIAKLCNKHYVVIFKNQDLTVEDQMRIASSIGTVKLDHGRDAAEKERILIEPGVIRVTGELNNNGDKGLFGHDEELDWHTHHANAVKRFPYVWLYSVKGSVGSMTSWINQEMAYNDLSINMQHKLETIKYASGYKVGAFSDMAVAKEKINYDNPINLVHTNREGKKGLYFPFQQVYDIVEGATKEEWKELHAFLKNHCTQEKYIYHHAWQDKDLVISEQWLSIHKRWKFDGMKSRLLHRIAFDYDKAYTKEVA